MSSSLTTTISTTAVPSQRRLAYWNDAVDRVFGSLAVDSNDEGFNARMVLRDLADTRLVMINSPRAEVRTLGHPTAPARPAFKLDFQDQGSCRYRHSGHETVVCDGEFTLCDTASPYSISFTGSHRLMAIYIPADQLIERLGDPAPYLNRPLGRRPRAALFSSMLRNLWATSWDNGDALWEATMSRMVLDLLTLACRESDDGKAADLVVNPEWRRRLCAHIEQHIADPELRTSSIAQVFGVSSRYIQMVFAGQASTVTNYIQDRRLTLAAERLRGGGQFASISNLALDVGFRDISHFSRCFKAKFGMSAREYRAGGGAG